MPIRMSQRAAKADTRTPYFHIVRKPTAKPVNPLGEIHFMTIAPSSPPQKNDNQELFFSFAEGGKGVGIPFFGVAMSPSHPAVGWYAQRHLNLLLFLLRLAGITLRRRLG